MTQSPHDDDDEGLATISEDAEDLLRALVAAPPRRPGFGALPVVVGTLRLESELGRGGMSSVYRGTDLRLGRPVAAKVSQSHVHAEARARLYAEARAAARLRHDRIVSVYGIEEHEGYGFIVMELVEGSPLSRLLKTTPDPLGERGREVIVGDIVEALAAAHEAGVVHRDVKPSNILVEAANGRAKLGDFGVARMQLRPADVIDVGRTGLSATGTVVGTPAYMAPEQLRGETASYASDVFSVGLVIVEALTGWRPPRSNTLDIPPESHIDGEGVARLRSRGGLARELVPVLRRATRHDAAERYPDARSMFDDVRQASLRTKRARLRRSVGLAVLAIAFTAAMLVLLAWLSAGS